MYDVQTMDNVKSPLADERAQMARFESGTLSAWPERSIACLLTRSLLAHSLGRRFHLVNAQIKLNLQNPSIL